MAWLAPVGELRCAVTCSKSSCDLVGDVGSIQLGAHTGAPLHFQILIYISVYLLVVYNQNHNQYRTKGLVCKLENGLKWA